MREAQRERLHRRRVENREGQNRERGRAGIVNGDRRDGEGGQAFQLSCTLKVFKDRHPGTHQPPPLFPSCSNATPRFAPSPEDRAQPSTMQRHERERQDHSIQKYQPTCWRTCHLFSFKGVFSFASEKRTVLFGHFFFLLFSLSKRMQVRSRKFFRRWIKIVYSILILEA